MAIVERHHDRLDFYVDLDRFPIHEPDRRVGQSLIAEAHAMMATDTPALFNGFLRPAAVECLRGEIEKLESTAHQVDYPCMMYSWLNNAGFPDGHPRSRALQRCCGVITTDQFNEPGTCRELYHIDELTEFVRRLLRIDTLYRSACPTLSIQINVMRTSQSFAWHFDTNDGTVSFTIQNADEGGEFQYAPLIRDEDDENYEAVTRILNGCDSPRRPTMEPGCFFLFLGRRSLHRVVPVGVTSRSRQSLLLSYDRQPGHVFPTGACERLTNASQNPFLGVTAST